MNDASHARSGGLSALIFTIIVAIGLTFAFWLPLYEGAGFVGGDTYSYYMPQKDVLADSLQSGELPMWHHRTGWGYPMIAESQTGVLYPPTLACFWLFDLNTAYNANHLLHYVLAFVFLWLYASRLGLRTLPGLLAATVYVYGWFPPRSSLEWTIIGGTWLPAALWATESFLQSGSKRWLIVLASVLGFQLLAGHFALAFITLLALPLYVVLRLWFAPDMARVDLSRAKLAGWLIIPIVASFTLAAVQLMPTWELKTNSQRAEVTEEHNPAYGHMPPIYLSQLVASWWFWYEDDVNLDEANKSFGYMLASKASTNRVEAHLYFGLAPLVLLLVAVFSGRVFCGGVERVWAIIGLVFLAYAPAWFVPITRHLPGFSFFHGPGRYTIITALAAGIVAAFVADNWIRRRRVFGAVVCLAIIASVVVEFRVVARQISNALIVETPIISRRSESVIAKHLADRRNDVRLYGPGPNLPNLCGVAAMPVYLGLGPDEYYDTNITVPADLPDDSVQKIDWMVAAGITHVLSQRPLQSDRFTTVSDSPDIFLNRAWGRPTELPVYLYQLKDARPRVYCDVGSVEVVELRANRVTLKAKLSEAGRVVLTDLMAPGWSVTIDGEPSSPVAKPDLATSPIDVFRSVEVPAGEHTIEWNYSPTSVYLGAAVSGLAWLVTVVLFVLSRSKPLPDKEIIEPGKEYEP